MDRDDTFRALCTLRDAGDLASPQLAHEWDIVWRALSRIADNHRVGRRQDRDDALQETLLKVRAGIRDLRAEHPGAAHAWLKVSYRRVTIDQLRAAKRHRTQLALVKEDPTLHAPAPSFQELPSELVEEQLAPFEDALDEAIDAFVATQSPVRRPQNKRKARLAYELVIRGKSYDALHQSAGDVSRDTLYQWLRRGRVQVLIPAVRAWLEELRADEPVHLFATHVLEELENADRADAGKPRPERKRTPSVRSDDDCASAQYDDPEDRDD